MLKLHKLFTLFIISILFQPLIAFSLEINGKATYNYTSIGDYELNKEIIRSKAMNLACKDAFKNMLGKWIEIQEKIMIELNLRLKIT